MIGFDQELIPLEVEEEGGVFEAEGIGCDSVLSVGVGDADACGRERDGAPVAVGGMALAESLDEEAGARQGDIKMSQSARLRIHIDPGAEKVGRGRGGRGDLGQWSQEREQEQDGGGKGGSRHDHSSR